MGRPCLESASLLPPGQIDPVLFWFFYFIFRGSRRPPHPTAGTAARRLPGGVRGARVTWPGVCRPGRRRRGAAGPEALGRGGEADLPPPLRRSQGRGRGERLRAPAAKRKAPTECGERGGTAAALLPPQAGGGVPTAPSGRRLPKLKPRRGGGSAAKGAAGRGGSRSPVARRRPGAGEAAAGLPRSAVSERALGGGGQSSPPRRRDGAFFLRLRRGDGAPARQALGRCLPRPGRISLPAFPAVLVSSPPPPACPPQTPPAAKVFCFPRVASARD